jgi:hypothetical protein
MQVDVDPVEEPLDGDDQKPEQKPEMKPEVEVKPEIHVVHESLVSAPSVPAGGPLPPWLKPEAQIMMQAEDIVKTDPRRRAAMAGLLCDLVGDDCSAMSVTLKVCWLLFWSPWFLVSSFLVISR